MITVYCRKCEARHLASEKDIESVHRSSEGLVGYARCARGHLVIHHFVEAYPKPPPPASVLALRARQASTERAAAEATGSD